MCSGLSSRAAPLPMTTWSPQDTFRAWFGMALSWASSPKARHSTPEVTGVTRLCQCRPDIVLSPPCSLLWFVIEDREDVLSRDPLHSVFPRDRLAPGGHRFRVH